MTPESSPTPKTANRTAVYCRTANYDNKNLAEQVIKTATYAVKSGGKLVRMYYECASGHNMDSHPKFRQLMNDCISGKIDRLVVSDFSRFGHNSHELADIINFFDELGIIVEDINGKILNICPDEVPF